MTEPLEKKCQECNGQGCVQAPEWAEWWKGHRSFPDPGHSLFKINEEIPCSCYGYGVVPTPYGLEILLFVSRYLGGHVSIEEL